MKYRLIFGLIGVVLLMGLAPGAARASDEGLTTLDVNGEQVNIDSGVSLVAFVLHLECENGVETDILVPSRGSYAGLVLDANSVGVLKGVDADADGVPEFLVPGFELSDLTRCAAFSEVAGELSFVFVAYVLFTPRGG